MEVIELRPEDFEFHQNLMIYIGKCPLGNVVFKIFNSNEDEFKLLNLIDSPYVIKPLGIGKLNNRIGLITEYANGGDLFDFLYYSSNPRRHNSEYLLTIILQIALGIREIHRSGIFHRNIKPENIVLKKEGEDIRAMIIDFEYSIYLDSFVSENVMSYGTFQYNPPEMDGMTKLSYSADIYAFGICILMILMPEATRVPTFEDFEAFMKLEKTNYPDLDPLKEILSKIFVKNPKDRITINEIVEFEFIRNKIPYRYDSLQ